MALNRARDCRPPNPVLLLLPESPFPARAGNALRDSQHVAVLRRFGWTPMIAHACPRTDLTAAEEAAALAGEIALAGRLRAVQRGSWPSTVARKLAYATCSREHPFSWWLDSAELGAFFVDAIRRLRPGVVIARSLFLHLVPVIRRAFDGPLIVDCHDADEYLARELMRTVPAWRRAGPWANWRGVRRVMRRHLDGVDGVWAVSPIDRDRIAALVPHAPVTVVPSAMAPVGTPRPRAGFGPRVLMTANFDYGPNADGARWLLQTVWPSVLAARADARLVLVGRGASHRLGRAAACPSVTLLEPIPDLSRLYEDAALVVVPVHAGGGTRLKIVDACRHGKAIVTTAKGIEGLEAAKPAVIVANAPGQFADAVTALLGNPFRCASLGAAALDAFDRHLSLDALAATLGSDWPLPAGPIPSPA